MDKNFEELYPVCGALKSPDDDRDYQIQSLIMKAVKFPEKYIVPIPAIIANQKEVGSCVACTLAQIKHCQEKKELNDDEMFSAAYIYGNRKEDDWQESGMFPRQALQNLVEYGMCHQKDFPGYDTYEYEQTRELYLANKKELDKKAKPYRISSYYRLNDLDDIKLALYTVGYVQICYDVYKCLYYPDKDGMINYNPLLKGKCFGGHSMTVCAYDDERGALGIINSWDKDYGVGIDGIADGGCIWIPYEYPFSEAWCAIDAKTEKELMKEYGNKE